MIRKTGDNPTTTEEIMKQKTKLSKRLLTLALCLFTVMQIFCTALPASAANGVVENFEPYQVSNRVTLYKGEPNKSFTMMGHKYIYGLTMQYQWSDNVELLFNLSKEYALFSFDIGHIDNSNNASTVLQVYKDGVLADEINLYSNMSTINYQLNVSGTNQLRFTFKNEVSGFAYGMANITTYTAQGATASGITTIPANSVSEQIYKTNIIKETNVLPYQNSSRTKLYTGDINKSFSMMGNQFINGITMQYDWNDNIELLFNLGKEYSLFSFDIGHLDNSDKASAILQIFKDGELADEISLLSNMATIHYELNVSGTNQLRFAFKAEASGFAYGMANIAVSKTSAVPPVSESELVINTNLNEYNYVLPYQNSNRVKLYNGDINKTFSMMGNQFINGLTMQYDWSDNIEVLFNLGKEYSLLSFDIGHLDNSNKASAILQIFKDGELADEISLSSNMATLHYELNVTDTNQLRFAFKSEVSSFAYGMANIRVYSRTGLVNAGISTIPNKYSSAPVIDSNLIPEGYILPYQNSNRTTLYHGDINTYFTMMEKQYTNGVTMSYSWNDNIEMLFNLGHLYDSMSFTIGHLDGKNADSVSLQIFKDGVYSEEIALSNNMAPIEYTIDTKGVNQLRFAFNKEVSFAYGIGDITGVHNHDIVTTPAVAPTCTKDGTTEGKHCSTCGVVIEEASVVLSTGHIWSQWTVVEPEGAKDGEKTRTCYICDEVEKVVLPGTLENPFTDIKQGKWYTAGVLWCFNFGYMAGMSDSEFGYKTNVTRAMFATILAVIDGADVDGYTNMSFTDVKPGKWYSGAIEWAASNGYAAGMGEGIFGYKNDVTREQLAMFFYTYSEKNGIDVSGRANIAGYEDYTRIHSYALEAISWAVSEGLISGTSATTLSPRASGTRAEIAVIVMNYIQKLINK